MISTNILPSILRFKFIKSPKNEILRKLFEFIWGFSRTNTEFRLMSVCIPYNGGGGGRYGAESRRTIIKVIIGGGVGENHARKIYFKTKFMRGENAKRNVPPNRKIKTY